MMPCLDSRQTSCILVVCGEPSTRASASEMDTTMLSRYYINIKGFHSSRYYNRGSGGLPNELSVEPSDSVRYPGPGVEDCGLCQGWPLA